jgi:ABC-2 type transport system ATP-binding protein
MSAVDADKLTHKYKSRTALNEVSFRVERGEIFGLLGPNGGGKSTTFRILSTFLSPSSGTAQVFGLDVRTAKMEIRKRIGVVFQSGSLDRKLTADENLLHHGHLYGLKGEALRVRIRQVLVRFGLQDRVKDRVETLSGGLRRRLEIAKGVLHKPELLLLDEPSTGLDPAVRLELWAYLKELRDQEGTTVLLTTHFMEEAEKCDRIAILDAGNLIDIGAPEELKRNIGGEVVTIQSRAGESLREFLKSRFGITSQIVNGTIRFEVENGQQWITKFIHSFSGEIDSITIGRPTLEDVFIHYTGHRLESEA